MQGQEDHRSPAVRRGHARRGERNTGPGILNRRPIMKAIFPANEGTLDRVMRVILGLVLISIVFVGPKTLWGWLGAIPLLTGTLGNCPLYRLLGLSTCPAHA